MGERSGTRTISEQRERGIRTFRLLLTKREVGITSGRDRSHPVFPYHIKEGEQHMVGNLEISSGIPCLRTNSVEITFKDSHSGDHGIRIDDIRLEGGILLLGTKGSAALREIKRNDIIMLEMSLSRSISIDMVNPRNKSDIHK